MKIWLPILIVFAGLGSSISFSQVAPQNDPFSRYLAGLKANRPEAALVRVAQECGVDLKSIKPGYAQRPNTQWIPVKDLSAALNDQETDFYATLAVWSGVNSGLVEQWSMELDTGSYVRSFFCFRDQKIRFAETIDWSIPVEVKSETNQAWGFEQRWKIGLDGKYESVLRRFVNLSEEPMVAPKLDAETIKQLDWSPMVRTWEDMKLPAALLP